MKTNFTYLGVILIALFYSLPLLAQNAGDYRSNTTNGLWSAAASWQTFDGLAWNTATVAPSSSDGVITIRSGDSIRLNTATSLDEVVIQSNGKLSVFNLSTATTFTLNDGTGDDLLVESGGKLYLSINGTLSGTGNVYVNSGGSMTIRSGGIIAAPTTNQGTLYFSGIGTVSNTTVTNNGTMVWLSDYIQIYNGGSIVNNDSMSIQLTSGDTHSYMTNSGAAGTFDNAGGIMFIANSGVTVNVNSGINFANSGVLKGFGGFNVLSTTLTNTGSMDPGNSAGTLTVNPSLITGKTPSTNIEISSTGATAGTNYDQLVVTGTGATNISGLTLNMTDEDGGDPVNTVYTILNVPSGTITGTFAAANFPSNFGNLTYNTNNVTIQKLSLLPVVWGSFTALAQNNTVLLSWSTLQEDNTSHFVVERSTDGAHFTAVTELAAKGHSTVTSYYTYTDLSPDAGKTNYYRLQQVDLDGAITYSDIRTVTFNNGKVVAVQASPNPMQNVLRVTVQEENISISFTDLNGRVLRVLKLAPGFHQVNVQDLPRGVYQLSVFQNAQLIETQRMVKL